MIFTTQETEYQRLLHEGYPLLKASHTDGFVDAWFGEQREQLEPFENHPLQNLHLKLTDNGIFGWLETDPSTSDIETAAFDAYRQIFRALAQYPEWQAVRYWNYVPDILSPVTNARDTENTTSAGNVYQRFNAGRYRAFQSHFGEALVQMPAPAASAVGAPTKNLRIEFLAVKKPLAAIENKDQIPAYRYSEKFGRIAPYFSRGTIIENKGQRLLLSSGTASVAGEASLHPGDIYEQLSLSIHNLRILGSQFNLKRYDIHYGFALEDIAALRVYYKRPEDLPFLRRFVPKFLAPDTRISFFQAAICRDELLVELEAVYVKKGETESGAVPKYRLDNQRIRTESFEIHVAEHCNLKCRDCCNISPFNAKKFISLEEVTEIAQFVNQRFRPDVFKIAGGEPTLHPQLDEILQIVKKTCPGTVLRVISNGLLLHRMSTEFWKNIDQLTISNYISAPVKPKLLDEIRRKAREHEVVLNIKFVEQFNEIFVDDRIEEKEKIRGIYDDCWMRHRCLIIRGGQFYKCTRAAYMNDFLSLKGKSATAGTSTYSEADGIDLNHPDFQDRALSYLNDASPLLSCEYCLGVSGGLRENIQLKTINGQLQTSPPAEPPAHH